MSKQRKEREEMSEQERRSSRERERVGSIAQ